MCGTTVSIYSADLFPTVVPSAATAAAYDTVRAVHVTAGIMTRMNRRYALKAYCSDQSLCGWSYCPHRLYAVIAYNDSHNIS